jgi:hypothetical protein
MKPVLILFALLLAGCSSTKPKPVVFPVSPLMATAYTGGEMIITWKAKVGETYTIYFTDAPRGKLPDWKPLPQANGLKGTGLQITVRDKIDSEDQRRYRLLADDQKPY